VSETRGVARGRDRRRDDCSELRPGDDAQVTDSVRDLAARMGSWSEHGVGRHSVASVSGRSVSASGTRAHIGRALPQMPAGFTHWAAAGARSSSVVNRWATPPSGIEIRRHY
jgi:hypothetical protein